MYREKCGKSLKEARHSKRSLDFISIHAHPDASPERPAWLVVHHYGDESGPRGTSHWMRKEHEPEAHEFGDHREMIAHVHKHTSTEPLDEEQEGY